MKVMRWINGFSIFVLFVLIARSAFADVTPELLRSRGSCSEYVMCIAIAVPGECLDGGDEIVLDMQGNTSITFYSTQSTATTFVCDIISNDEGFDATAGDGFKINNDSLAEDKEVLTLSGGFSHIWITCPTVSGAAVRITANVCRDQAR